jgi:hypothetical protein
MSYTRLRSVGEDTLSLCRRFHKISAFDSGISCGLGGRDRIGTVVLLSVETINATARRHLPDQREEHDRRSSEAPRAASSLERAS